VHTAPDRRTRLACQTSIHGFPYLKSDGCGFESHQELIIPGSLECSPRLSFGTGAIDFAITFIIEPLELESPIFFLEIKPPTHLNSVATRKFAENQIRAWFTQLAHLVQVPKLYGVSAIGVYLSYYTYERANRTIEPIALADSANEVMGTAPETRWNMNIMEEEGRAKFLRVVEEIKQMVAIIGTGLCILLFNLPLHHFRGVVIYFVPMS